MVIGRAAAGVATGTLVAATGAPQPVQNLTLASSLLPHEVQNAAGAETTGGGVGAIAGVGVDTTGAEGFGCTGTANGAVMILVAASSVRRGGGAGLAACIVGGAGGAGATDTAATGFGGATGAGGEATGPAVGAAASGAGAPVSTVLPQPVQNLAP